MCSKSLHECNNRTFLSKLTRLWKTIIYSSGESNDLSDSNGILYLLDLYFVSTLLIL